MKKLLLIALLLPISVFAKGGGHGGGHSGSHSSGHSSGHSFSSHGFSLAPVHVSIPSGSGVASSSSSCSDSPKWYQFTKKRCTNNN